MQPTGWTTENGAAGRIEVFEYPADPNAPALPAWNGWATEAQANSCEEPARERAQGARDAGVHAEHEQRLAEETRRSFEAGRERGRQEGRQVEREAQAVAQVAAEERRVRQAAALIERFAEERDRYLQAVEHEVVELALAVAARILRREAQMDPLLLTGAVRVDRGAAASASCGAGLVDRSHCPVAQSCAEACTGCRRRNAAGRLRD